MFDKLKFWNKEEAPQDPFGSDPLSVPDPMQDASDSFADPLQSASNSVQGADPYQTPSDPFQNAMDSAREGYEEYNQQLQNPTQQPAQYSSLQNSPFGQKTAQYEVPQGKDRDTELILAKLDAIKSELDSVHQRVRRLEEQSERKRQQYW